MNNFVYFTCYVARDTFHFIRMSSEQRELGLQYAMKPQRVLVIAAYCNNQEHQWMQYIVHTFTFNV